MSTTDEGTHFFGDGCPEEHGQATDLGKGIDVSSSNITYVRWRRDESREARVFPPLAPEHPAYAADCFLCSEPLGNGGQVQLLALGPEDADDRAKHVEGRWYSALAILLHAACVQGVEPEPDPVETVSTAAMLQGPER